MLNERLTGQNIREAISYVNEIFGIGYIEEYYAEDRTPFSAYYENKDIEEKPTDSGGVGGRNTTALGQYDLGSGFDSEGEGEAEGNIKGRRYSLIFL